MPRLAHIVNPFSAPVNSDLYFAQPITFDSMRKARDVAASTIDVELLAACFPEDLILVPKTFKAVKPLERSVLDFSSFKKPYKLPLIGDILSRLYHESSAEYLIYTNADIGLYPEFYLRVHALIRDGHDAFIINRRRLPSRFMNAEYPEIVKQKGRPHPGFDCFVFHRSMYPKLKLDGICIGVPFIEIAFSQNLFALSSKFKLVYDEVLTFHIGEEIFKRRAPREYFFYNRKKFHKIESALFETMRLKKFPFQENPFVTRIMKYALHPCIPIRLVIKLLWRDLIKAKNN